MRACGISVVLQNFTAGDHVGVVDGRFGCLPVLLREIEKPASKLGCCGVLVRGGHPVAPVWVAVHEIGDRFDQSGFQVVCHHSAPCQADPLAFQHRFSVDDEAREATLRGDDGNVDPGLAEHPLPRVLVGLPFERKKWSFCQG